MLTRCSEHAVGKRRWDGARETVREGGPGVETKGVAERDRRGRAEEKEREREERPSSRESQETPGSGTHGRTDGGTGSASG